MRSAIAAVLSYEAQKKKYTNKIRNPRGEGGVVGVIGSGGALPTNWAQINSAGLSQEVIGGGVEDGLPYTDLRYFGTSTSAANIQIRFDQSTNAAAVAGQAWGFDFWVKAQSGAAPQISAVIGSFAVGSSLTTVAQSASIAPNSAKIRVEAKGVVSAATADNVRAYLFMPLANSTAYDFTIRIYAPKLVQIASIEGPELVTNGDFASGTTGYTPVSSTIAAVAGELELTGVGSPYPSAYQSFTSVVGQVYVARARGRKGTAANAQLLLQNSFTSLAQTTTTSSSLVDFTPIYAAAVSTSTKITASISNGGAESGTAYFDNLSVKQVTPGYMPAFPILPAVGVIADSIGYGIAA